MNNIIKAEVKTIMPLESNRAKRGLTNGIGNIYMWLFELIDDVIEKKY